MLRLVFSFTCKTIWFIALSIYCPISFCVRHKFEIQISQVVVQGNMLKLDMVDELFIHLTLKLLQFIENKIVWVNSGTGRFRFPWIRLFSHFLEGFSTNRMMQMQLSSALLSEFNPLTPKDKIISHSFTGSFCFVSYVCFLLSYVSLQLFNFFC